MQVSTWEAGEWNCNLSYIGGDENGRVDEGGGAKRGGRVVEGHLAKRGR